MKESKYKVGDKIIILTGENKDRIGTVQGHYDTNLIVSFEKETQFSNVHEAEVTKWFD